MTILDRWLWVRHLKAFSAVLAAMCLLYCVIDFSDRSQAYTGAGWVGWTAKLYVYRALKVAVLLSPIASLMACGLTLSSARRHSEWTALLAAGVSPLRILMPLAASALAIGALTSAFDDSVAVAAALKAERITAEHFHLWGSYASYFEPKRWVRAGTSIVHFGPPLSGGGSSDVTVLQLSPAFTLERRIDAQEAIPRPDGRFELRGARIRDFDGLKPTFEPADSLTVDLPGAQSLFALQPGKPEMLSSSELERQVRTRKALGLPSAEQRYELAARYADALAGLAGALIAAALALRGARRGHLNASLVEGVATAGALWAAAAIFKSLSLANRATPWLCAFAPVLLAAAFGLIAVYAQTRRPAA